MLLLLPVNMVFRLSAHVCAWQVLIPERDMHQLLWTEGEDLFGEGCTPEDGGGGGGGEGQESVDQDSGYGAEGQGNAGADQAEAAATA